MAKIDYDTIKNILLYDLDTYAPNQPLLEGIEEEYLGRPLKYECTLVTYKDGNPVWDIWNKQFFHAFVHAHLYSDMSGQLLAHSALGFKEFTE